MKSVTCVPRLLWNVNSFQLIGSRPASTSLQGNGPLKSNWKQNVVYLYQFPRPATNAPNLSPFCLKIETFLKANNLKHETIGTWLTLRQSPRGLLPFIELNGQQITDSQIIIWKLQKHFELKDEIDPKDRGTARAIERMVDLSTNYALLIDKSVKNAHLLLSRQVSNAPLPALATNYLAKGFSKQIEKRVNGVLGKLDKEELKEVLRRDVDAIDSVLGDKKFLFGDRITSIDCSVFGQLAAVFYLPYRQQITDLLEDDYPRVRKYLDRIRAHYFPEWEDC